jgi:integrase/recombinase XerD
MSRFDEPQYEPLLEKLREHLRAQRYGVCARAGYPYAARSFLRYLEQRGWSLEAVTPERLDRYLSSRRRKGSRRAYSKQFRRMHAAAIRMLLRVICGRWPPPPQPRSARERADLKIIEGYDAWMRELRGLSPQTRRHARAEARLLLNWMHTHKKTAARLSVADLDAYLGTRSQGKRRTSIAVIVSLLRGVLRHFHRSGLMGRDLSGEVEGPPLYALEGIPSVIRPEEVAKVLKRLKHDRSVLGRRDHAIWMLLVSYGLRAGEIKALKLSDIDWRGERLRIRHAKTAAYSELPLLRAPAEALLSYLQHGRPVSAAREVFLRPQAPYVGLASNTSLAGIVGRRLAAVGVARRGRQGAHALRHARAVSLLRGGVPLKVIGDVLGHRAERSTGVYLKLATQDLRAVALDVPKRVRSVEVAP